MPKSTIRVLLMSPQYDDPGGMPPFGMAYLAGFLRGQSSVELTIINSDEFDSRDLKELVAYVEYDVFATGGLITCFQFCRDMFKLSSTMRPKARRVVGGPLTVLDPHLLFQVMSVDVAVVGEGEETFSELLEVFRREDELGGIRGIVYRDKNNRISATEPRPPIDLRVRDLEPDWSFVDMERYIAYPNKKGFFYNRFDSSRPYRVGHVMAGRGCPFRCSFCGSPLGRFRRRRHEAIINEMKRWRDQYTVDHIRFINETLFMRPQDIEPLCRMMIDEKLNLHWSCDLRVDSVNRDSLKLMKEAGCCVYINYGIESGSDMVLQMMNKRTTVEQNRTAIKLTREAGIYPHLSIMFGYCDETLEDIKKTVDLMLEGDDLPESLAVTTPMPGTEMYRKLIFKGLIRDEVEYLDRLCCAMSKGAIYGEKKPILNPTRIPDNIYWQSLLAEKRRLYTEHYSRNRALLFSFEFHGDSVRLHLSCPHCQTTFDVNVCIENPKISRHFCKQCLHYIWLDPFLIPEFKKHFAQIGSFLQRVENERMPLVLYATPQLSELFVVDPWNAIWRNVTSIIGDMETFYYYKVVSPKHAQRLVPAAVLITGTDATNSIRKELIRKGFAGNDIISLFPTMPIRNFRQLTKRLQHLISHEYPVVRKLYRYLRSRLHTAPGTRKKSRHDLTIFLRRSWKRVN